MRIDALEPNQPRARAADWVELCALTGGPYGFGLPELEATLELPESAHGLLEDEGDTLEEEILQSRFEPYTDAILMELVWREQVLGELYPFQVRRVGHSWRLLKAAPAGSAVRLGRRCYDISLLISALRYRHLTGTDAEELTEASDRIFQILAHLSARGLFSGNSFWMGFPRPEHDGFRAALGRLISLLGVGELLDPPPVSQARGAKDGGIDVIAWRAFPDGRPAPILSYGQVASGLRWQDKSVRDTVDSHFHHWMSREPAKHYLPAMYIPFMQHETISDTDAVAFEAKVLDQDASAEKRLGMVLDRVRLTQLSTRAVERASDNDVVVVREALSWRRRALAAMES